MQLLRCGLSRDNEEGETAPGDCPYQFPASDVGKETDATQGETQAQQGPERRLDSGIERRGLSENSCELSLTAIKTESR
jgi:hypothetical protein